MSENILTIKNLNYSIENLSILENINIEIPYKKVSAIFGDSGSGKTTILKILSLLFREENNYKISGEIFFTQQTENNDLLKLKTDLWQIRKKIVYLSQVPNPLNLSIYKNVAFPLILQGIKDKELIELKVIAALKDVNLYDEVKERLSYSALDLSGGQKQKLCIARALVLVPEIILLDEPTSSLDSKNKEIIEDLIIDLGKKYTILIVSHDKDQIKKTASTFFECREKGIVKIENIFS